MKLLRHSEFIEKFNRYSEAVGRIRSLAANHFMRVYVTRHASDPRIPELGHLTHEAVLRMSNFVNMSSMDTIRADLLAKFKIELTDTLRPKPKFLSKANAKCLLRLSGLNWFEVNGQLAIHWNEKETKAVPV